MPHKPMSTKEYRAACVGLDLSPSYSAAPALGISRVTASRYASGSAKVATPVALLLRTMILLEKCKKCL